MSTKYYQIIIVALLGCMVFLFGYQYTYNSRLQEQLIEITTDRDHYRAALVDSEYNRQADADLLRNYQEALLLFKYADSSQANRFEIIMEGLDTNQ